MNYSLPVTCTAATHSSYDSLIAMVLQVVNSSLVLMWMQETAPFSTWASMGRCSHGKSFQEGLGSSKERRKQYGGIG